MAESNQQSSPTFNGRESRKLALSQHDGSGSVWDVLAFQLLGAVDHIERLEEQLEASLSFDALREQNEIRARRWHPGFPEDDDWNGADWSNAMCGEAGEAANIVKKLRRIETGKVGTRPVVEPELRVALANELADVVIYADLVAAKYGIHLSGAVVGKFNEVSERHGFPERLPACYPASEPEVS